MFKKKAERDGLKQDGGKPLGGADQSAQNRHTGAGLKPNKLGNLHLMNIEKSVIDEVSEAEENNMTQAKLGNFRRSSRGPNSARTDTASKAYG